MKRFISGVLLFTIILFAATSGNLQWTQFRSDNRHGTGAYGQASDGTGTSGNLAKYNADGSLTDGPSATGLINAGTYGSLPAVSTAGRAYLTTDGYWMLRDDGANWSPWGSIFPLTAPVFANFTWANQGTASAVTTNGGIYMVDTASGSDRLRLLTVATPTAPYTCTTAFIPLFVDAQFLSAGIALYDGTKVATWWWKMVPGRQLTVDHWTNVTTFSANVFNNNVTALNGSLVFLRIVDDNTNRLFKFSMDGQNYIQAFSEGRTVFLTPNKIGIVLDDNNATWPAGSTFLDWSCTTP